MNAVLDFKFNEIIGLLVILIEHNNVSFVSTTKIGLSILTTLLSRAELIIGEGSISATDLSEWSSCYDELFTSLESRIAAIFHLTLKMLMMVLLEKIIYGNFSHIVVRW